MTTIKFYNRSGTLTAYALACGYIEREVYPECTVELFMEHAHYQVQLIATMPYRKIIDWESFDNLTDARRAFGKLQKVAAK